MIGSKLQRGFFFGNSHTLNQMPAMRGRGGRGRGDGSGPGRGRGAHVDNEYVETEDLLRVAKSVSSFVLEWCQAADLSK